MTFGAYIGLYLAGLATFASPCILPLLPLYLSVLGGSREGSRARLALAGVGFSLGLSFVFVTLGMGASALATELAGHRRVLMLVAGGTMVVFGLALGGIGRLSALERDLRPLLARVPSPGGFAGGLLFGAAFALGWTPCVGPVLGAALSYAASHSSSPFVAGTELASYALGLSTPLVAAAFAAPRVLAVARRLRGGTAIVQRVMSVALVAMGLLVATDHLGALAPVAANTAARASTERPCELPGSTACALGGADAAHEPATLPSGVHLVEFMGAHCHVCAKMAPVVAELERACTSNDGTIVRVDVETGAGRALANRFNVHAVPTFVQVDAQGSEVERVVGEQSREELALALASVRGRACVL